MVTQPIDPDSTVQLTNSNVNIAIRQDISPIAVQETEKQRG